MPPAARILGLLFVAVCPAVSAAQTGRPSHGPSSAYERTPVGQHLPVSRSRVVRADYQETLPPQTPLTTSGKADTDTTDAAETLSLAPREEQSIRLPSRGRSGPAGKTPGTRSGSLGSLVPVAGSLALVVGLFLLVAWGMRRAAPASLVALPGEVFEVLGRAPLAGRQQVHLLRCGNKLILVSTTDAGAETLAEITDPPEVDRLAGLCRQAQPGSATATFRHVLQQLAPRNPDSDLRRPE
jgi:flagellar biogenesis protein FliO